MLNGLGNWTDNKFEKMFIEIWLIAIEKYNKAAIFKISEFLNNFIVWRCDGIIQNLTTEYVGAKNSMANLKWWVSIFKKSFSDVYYTGLSLQN